jgi:Na+-driven multidrug efflux pump
MGSAPIVGFNDGADNRAELRSIFKKSLVIIGTLSAAMVALAELLSYPLSKIFVGYDPSLLSLTLDGFRIFALSFFFMGLAIYASGFFTALNDGVTSAIISFLRTVVFQVAAVLLLPLFFEITGVWISIIVAELMAALLSIVFLIIKRKRYKYC